MCLLPGWASSGAGGVPDVGMPRPERDSYAINMTLSWSKAGSEFFVTGAENMLDQARVMRLRPCALAA